MVRELTCIVCPLGCDLKVELDENKRVLSVSGNTCPRGKVYAENECVNPRRTVTSTVRCEDGSMISVKTDTTIPKDKIFECMKIINENVVSFPVSVGDIIICDVFGSNIVATSSKN